MEVKKNACTTIKKYATTALNSSFKAHTRRKKIVVDGKEEKENCLNYEKKNIAKARKKIPTIRNKKQLQSKEEKKEEEKKIEIPNNYSSDETK